MKRVLIAGATGYLGRHVIVEAKRRRYVVRALTRDASKLEELHESIDEVYVGKVTDPESIKGACEGVDVVFSSVGITRQKDNLTYDDVDYRGNVNLLADAIAAGASRFVYVSVFAGEEAEHLRIISAKRRFEERLMASGIGHVIVRPNGFFSDMVEFLRMARNGRGYVFGDGEFRMNPIHGEDLAQVCVDAFSGSETTISVGGPEVLTHNEMLRLAFHAVGRDARVSYVPVWVARLGTSLVRLFASVKTYGPIEFFTTVLTHDMVAPTYGERRLEAFFAEQSSEAS